MRVMRSADGMGGRSRPGVQPYPSVADRTMLSTVVRSRGKCPVEGRASMVMPASSSREITWSGGKP